MTNDAPNPPSLAEPQPKAAAQPPPPPRRNKSGEVKSPQVAPEKGPTPVNPDQADG